MVADKRPDTTEDLGISMIAIALPLTSKCLDLVAKRIRAYLPRKHQIFCLDGDSRPA